MFLSLSELVILLRSLCSESSSPFLPFNIRDQFHTHTKQAKLQVCIF
jgi:hypothetical protein